MHCRKISPKVKTAYKFYFGHEVREMISLHMLQRLLLTVIVMAGREKKKMLTGVPMLWREKADHSKDCYFGLTNIKGFSRKKQVKD